jgi:hypothetical protein
MAGFLLGEDRDAHDDNLASAPHRSAKPGGDEMKPILSAPHKYFSGIGQEVIKIGVLKAFGGLTRFSNLYFHR